MSVDARYDYSSLLTFATTVLTKAGLPEDRSRIVAETLVEADLMGHNTHGLQLLPAYAKDVQEGKMKRDGFPEVINDSGSVVVWDGHYLPGPWLIHHALDLALERIEEHPVMSISIRRSHHIACLAAYPERLTKRNLMMWLVTSDPRVKTIAPFGGIDPVFTPNPIAAGIPTDRDPIIFDISTSTTSNGLVMRSLNQGKKLPHPWLLMRNGDVTDDPSTFVANPPSTILPLGGLDSGHKGFALGLFVEALTSGLSGYGRADQPDTWGASVFLQVMDPDAFGGTAAFEKQTGFLVDACLQSTPFREPVRIPGHRALKLRDEQKKNGVLLHPTIPPMLEACAKQYQLTVDNALNVLRT